MLTGRSVLWLAAVAALAWCSSPGMASATPPRGETILSEATVLFAEAPNVPDLLRRFKRTQFGQILREPALQPMLRTMQVNWHGLPLGVEWESLLANLPGHAMFAIDWPDRNRGVRFVAVLEGGERRAQLAAEVAKAEAALARLQAWKHTVERNRTTIVVHTWPRVGAEKSLERDHLVYAWKDDSLVVADNLELISEVLARWTGNPPNPNQGAGRPALAANTSFVAGENICRERASLLAATHPPLAPAIARPALRWYAKPVTLAFVLDPLIARNGLSKDQYKRLVTLVQAGFHDVNVLSVWHYLAVDPEIDLLTHAAVPAVGVRDSARLLAAVRNSTAIAPPAWAPAGAVCTTLELDVPLAYETGCHLYRIWTGKPGRLPEALKSQADDNENFSIARNFLAHFGKRLTHVSIPAKELAVLPAEIWALEVAAPQALKPVLEWALKESTHRARKFGDVEIFEVYPPGFPSRQEAMIIPPEIRGVALVGNTLFYGSRVRELKQILTRLKDNNPPELAHSTERAPLALARLTPGAPTAAQTVGRLEPMFRPPYELFRQGGLAYDLTLVGRALNSVVLQEQQLSPAWRTLPAWEQIAGARLGQLGWKATATRRGWEITGVVLSNTPVAPPVVAQPAQPAVNCPPPCCCRCAPVRPRLWRLFARLRCR